MTQIRITIEGLNIYIEDEEATTPQMVRALHNIMQALEPYRPKGMLAVDENDNIVVVVGQMAAKTEASDGKPATIVAQLEDRNMVDADVQTHGQSYETVIKAVEYLQHLYSKKMVAIAQALVGRNPKAQAKWMERVVNGGII